VNAFSGPAAYNGQLHFAPIAWAVHDINKRGGILVDGKKKKIELIKADHMAKAEQCKKICERMILQEKVHILMGTPGSNMMKIMYEVGNKYKIPVWNYSSMSDEMHDAENFSRYTFMGSYSTESVSRAMAYYFGQIRKKEKKFYILNQDYGFGHLAAEAFKKGLKEYYPEAQVVGEDYHKLFLTDFAPYLTKIKAAGAEIVYTNDWAPDSNNLKKQARQMNIHTPFAGNYIVVAGPVMAEMGVEGTVGSILIDQFDIPNEFSNPGYVKFHKAWLDQYKKWKTPYNSIVYRHTSTGFLASYCMQTYWLLSAIERAQSVDPEKLIKILEGDSYQYVNGKIVKMRACDHKIIQDFSITELVPPDQQKISYTIPPYYWAKEFAYAGKWEVVPAEKALPMMDQRLDRCKGKNGWGE
jgi:ABC-type branched-subunit amino acid transport system substrate-binding protein